MPVVDKILSRDERELKKRHRYWLLGSSGQLLKLFIHFSTASILLSSVVIFPFVPHAEKCIKRIYSFNGSHNYMSSSKMVFAVFGFLLSVL